MQRRDELKSIFNTESVGERDYLLSLLLDESDEDSADDGETMSEEELRQMLKIHKQQRALEKKFHTRSSNAQYSFYSAGLISEHDRFPAHQQVLRTLKELIDGDSGGKPSSGSGK